jgi:hypothetical protein
MSFRASAAGRGRRFLLVGRLRPTRREFLGLASVPEDEERYRSDRLAEQAHCKRIGRSLRPRQVAIYGHSG